MSETFLTVKNAHDASCGKPPQVDAGPIGGYTGYFENQHGEQWVLRWPTAEQHIYLYGGDIGWEEPQRIPLPPKVTTTDDLRPVTEHLRKSLKINLSQTEQLWLAGCMLAIAIQRRA